MTYQSESPLRDALALIADVREYLERINYAATGWEGVGLYERVCDFMDQHRGHQQSAGGP